ncbi:MAG: DNA translocase FtsK [Clostridiales bacterium]|nr:DNA translocase FtsK [Clostridiales bacterium]
MAKKRKKKSANLEIAGVLLMALGAILAFGMYFNGAGLIGAAFKEVFMGVLGNFAYVLPIGVLVLGGYIAFYLQGKSSGAKTACISVIILCVICIWHLIFYGSGAEADYITSIGLTYSLSMAGAMGSGAFAQAFVYPITMLLGIAGGFVVFITAGLIAVMVLTRISIRTVREQVKGNIHMPERRHREKQTKIDPNRLSVDNDRAKEYREEPVKEKKGFLKFFSAKEDAASKPEERRVNRLGESEQDIGYLPYDLQGTGAEPVIPAEEPLPERTIPTEDGEVIVLERLPKRRSTRSKKQEPDEVPVVMPEEPKYTSTVPEDEKKKQYRKPPITMLAKLSPIRGVRSAKNDIKNNANLLERTFENFKIQAKVINVVVGSAITRYEVQPAPGVKISRIVNLADDIALSLAATSVRIEAPIPGKNAIGIEVPNRERTPVMLRDILESPEFTGSRSKLTVPVGKNLTGDCIVLDLAAMPHLLVAGTTGSGKSVCLQTMIMGLLFNTTPEEVRMIIVDPKKVDFAKFNNLPNMMIPVVTEPKKAAGALNWAATEMDKRYDSFAERGARDIERYNEIMTMTENPKIPYIVFIIDELADLMMTAPKDIEALLCRIAQKGRAAGIHLVVATQSPRVDVITGLIKANFPSRIALTVQSQTDSRIILDMNGAEKLLGRGDMLLMTSSMPKPVRVQGAFIPDQEMEAVTEFIRSGEEEPDYDEKIIEQIDNASIGDGSSSSGSGGDDDVDDLVYDAAELFLDAGQASTSMLQRRFRVGYARAARIMDQMERLGIVSPPDGSKPRNVLISRVQLDEMFKGE